jgi:hypothetical protein
MSSDIERPAVPLLTDDDDLSIGATATENTPLLRSEAASSHTVRDGSPASAETRRNAREAMPYGADITLGWKRATCILLSMWALIFLQGEPLDASLVGS